MTNASITRKLFWLERPQKHYADQVRHPGGGHGVRGDGAVRAAHRQLGFGGARVAAGAWAKAGVFLLGLGYCSAALALWMLYNLYMFWRALKRRGVYPCQRVGPAAHQLVLHLGCSALPAGGCWAGAAVHLCHWRCGGVYGADRAGHQNAFAQAVKMKDELDYTV